MMTLQKSFNRADYAQFLWIMLSALLKNLDNYMSIMPKSEYMLACVLNSDTQLHAL